MNNSVEKIGEYVIKKYINPSIEQISYVLRKDDKIITSGLSMIILSIVKKFLFRNNICIDYYKQLMQYHCAVLDAGIPFDFEKEKKYIKSLIEYIKEFYKKEYENLICNNFDIKLEECMNYIFDNYNILDIDYVSLFNDIVQLERENEIVKKIISSICEKMPYDLYRRIENELYYAPFICDSTIYY